MSMMTKCKFEVIMFGKYSVHSIYIDANTYKDCIVDVLHRIDNNSCGEEIPLKMIVKNDHSQKYFLIVYSYDFIKAVSLYFETVSINRFHG